MATEREITKVDPSKTPCGCSACRLKRAQQQGQENHSLSDGVFSAEPPSEWQRIGDRSPRASFARVLRSQVVIQNETD
jgi:hypothetical protein